MSKKHKKQPLPALPELAVIPVIEPLEPLDLAKDDALFVVFQREICEKIAAAFGGGSLGISVRRYNAAGELVSD